MFHPIEDAHRAPNTLESDMQKATPIAPPAIETEYVDVNMTSLYATVGALAVSTAGLAATTVVLWRRTKRNTEYLEALSEFTSRLVNETGCGRQAYDTLIDEHEEVEAPDYSEEPEELEEEPEVLEGQSIPVWTSEDPEYPEERARCNDCGEFEPLNLGSDLPDGICSGCSMARKLFANR